MNKVFNKIALAFTGLAMAIGVGVGIYNNNNNGVEPVKAGVATRYILNASGTSIQGSTATAIATSTTYNSYVDSTNGWAITLGNKQSNALWLGSNDNQKSKMTLASTGAGGGSISGHAAIASTIGVQTTATYYAAIIQTSGSISNVDKVTLKYSTPGGTAPSEAWVLYSTNSGTTWTIFQKVTSLSTSGTDFIHNNVASARYAFVIHSTGYCQFKSPILYFYGTDPDTQTISGSTSGTVGTGVTLTTNATSSTSWTITANTCGATLSQNTGQSIIVNATSAGSVSLTATCDGYTEATHTITFTSAAAESISVTGTSSMYVGDASISLTATPTNFSPSSYTWNSTNTGVATISGTGSTGTVSAVAKGTTQITASAQGTNGTVVSNSFTLTVKQFSIALSTASVSMKASKSTTVTVIPTDANGTVVITATSNNTSVATTSVSGTTITINSGSEGGVSTTITVSAKDNNGASGYHTAANKTINVEVNAGYIVGNKITALPTADKFVFLGNAGKTNWVGSTGSTLSTETDDANAALFIFSTTGTLRYYNEDTEQAGNYIYNTNTTSTTVSMNASSVAWASGLSDDTYPGLLQLSGGRFLIFSGGIKAFAAVNKTDANAPSFIYAYEAIASTPTVTLNDDNVSGMKGNSDSSLTMTISNFTASGLNITYKDSGESSFSASSDVASVSCGYTTGSNTVSVDFVGVGSTTVKLSVTRSAGDPIEKTFTVTVTQKPASMEIVHGEIVGGHLEVQSNNGQEHYKQVTFAGKDTDGNAYTITSGDVTPSIQSGNDHITVSGGRIYGVTAGTAVVRYTLNVLTSIYAELIIDVRDDYKTTVNTITVINGAEVSQGETLKVADHISTKTANTHFGSTMAIADSELLFSWTNDRSAGVIYSSFVFDVTDSTLEPDETETRDIYVFATFDENYAGTSFTAVIEVADRPVTGLKVDGVEKSNNDTITLTLPRNSTYNFNEHVTVNPVNATESHEVIYTLTTGSTYVSLTNGVMTIGSKNGTSVATITAKPQAKQDFVITFSLTITREAMEITADIPYTFTKVTSTSNLADGEYAIVYENGASSYAFDGATFEDAADNFVAASIEDGVLEATSALVAATVWITDTDDGYTIQSHDKTKYITGKQSNNNGCTIGTTATYNTITFGTESDKTVALIKDTSNNVMRMNPNSGNPWFRFYKSSTYTAQGAVQLYKLSGGVKAITVTDGCFNAINDAMSLNGGSYDLSLCDASGNTFDTQKWSDLAATFTSSIISENELAYARANREGNEVEQFLAAYDFVVWKYGDSYDFLGRVASGKIVRMKPFNILSNLTENGSSFLIITLTTIISITTVCGYFFLRKRKEQ